MTTGQIEQFHRDGFLVVEDLLPPDLVERLVARFDPLFAGDFETGIYPDEWHWNPYLGKPGAAGQMTGVWKCDRTLFSAMMSPAIGHMAATLEGWHGARLLADGIWQKPGGAKETTLHQDSMYINYHTPPSVVTCWIALSHAVAGASTIEYARGSHQWELSTAVPEFHNQNKSYRSEMEQAAQAVGVDQPDVVQLNIPPGGGVFHHGNTWHGSGKNTMDVVRRSMVLAYVPANAEFQPCGSYVPGGYIAGKYRRQGDNTMDESFFPIVWREDGYRTPFLDHTP
ncbi:phytanoyl-CoA dioxygenase family protein [Leptothoe sp. PORK10 BA2]|uniref:phytanoyl-CoA dioxygenase family protein n=1 Tax=Leptothoe sp. PORK10 BA2 TaxID=3110254 RepID=UPI002B203AF7|nr:phytanoyl-CoA dioxygenase family protein [Leptothoe sp. PORK10 BA2]